ncbi:hypothetical protein N9D94_00700 [Gammaproteobacteria bacterium]|nr:hypothetical protein [Gammaproteobacteria bacterium]
MYHEIQNTFSKHFQKSLVIIPFGLIFVVNLLITQINGFEYAGKFAVFYGASSFIAILFGMQWDIEVLVRERRKLEFSIIFGILTVLCYLVIFSVFYILISYLQTEYYLYLIIAASFIAINEILFNGLIKTKKYQNWILIKSLSPIALLILTINQVSLELTWLYAQVFPLSVLTILYLYNIDNFQFKNTLNHSPIFFQQLIKLVPITLSTLISNSILLFCLIGITYKLGSFEAGIWVNAYRVFSLPIVLCGAIGLPFILSTIGENTYVNKFKLFSKYLIFIFAIVILILPIIYIYGINIFQVLTKSTYLMTGSFCLIIFLTGAAHSIIQNLRSFFQSINRTYIFLTILIIFIFFICSLFLSSSLYSFENISNRIFYITLTTFFIINLYLIFLRYYDEPR